MMGTSEKMAWDMSAQLFFYLQRSVVTVGHKAEAMAHPEDMSVNRHRILAEGHGEHDIGSLPAHTRK